MTFIFPDRDLVIFLSLQRIPEIINLESDKVHFGSEFQMWQSMISWSCGFGSVVEHVEGVHGGAKLLTS